MRYDANQDLLWLLARPWVWIPRLIHVLTSLITLAVTVLSQGSSNDEDEQKKLAKRLLITLTNLGPCFIKVGQALSTRPDLIKREWLEELTSLQDNLPAFNHATALATLAEDLGAPASQLFEEFPGEPIAAASLGQVYKARLHGNQWVAVKVQRPQLAFILRRDLVIIRLLGVLSAPVLPLNLGFGLGNIIDEFGRSLFEEIDYEQEANNAERFAALFAKDPTVTVPRVERLLSSRRVLTTSWIEGTKLRDRKELKAQLLNPTALIRTAVISGLQQLFEFGYFHADPHPGNIFALSGQSKRMGHLAYCDFGMMDSISDDDRLTLTGAVVHLINNDFNALANDFQKLGFLSLKSDLTSIIPALEEVLGGSLGESVESFNFKAITDRFSELMFDYPFRVPARFALIIRAVVSQEGLALRLDPEFKIIGIAYPYVAKRLLAGDSMEMREKLMEVIFDNNGHLRLERIESLLKVISQDAVAPDAELIPVAGAGLKLLLGPDGSTLRSRLLMTLIKDERLSASDIKALMSLLRRTFSPRKVANGMLQNLNPRTT
ncbi:MULTISPECIES: ABC1 kinase family protein [unclassified Prochlorococcus]|uniref:ABC1 kinase family protein n=1 Tax=unclassified Prochlorococcus TaxID=2627481 RepID=UPI0005338137|nr:MULTISPECIES: AarF/ABC1/UbiB kinase family protein [unclassified Prochlorococcus]KGG29593.1 Ubiquinone biosynthesis monooxygenase UbiB [Prochlorococcus sp. MIT 0701]KGG30605.1 Ubiquinone biosynthesis monooxygenase UbiB [Prochlorococcus sp. MIT 0702]KGG34409.1 Ubiquinone biosynthesis monooxygenase UbiB [Prochlorococcus sp. MIT 0703]